MKAPFEILPGTGRGTMRRMVEGARHLRDRFAQPPAPSTACGGPPPRPGEDL
jgi:tRNA pseudouridine55 synthase